ncbi:hypothetical protein KGM_207883 [Danaus plexippus plexippus]|uniref:Uncharacterized protein n=1 Tax=Danaus plexippus plexippus TaxID=278856 RepID=A0A212EZJ7_DANPL|nr:hypothetical protein KGM_207883 [Danaus plexippus plexippus]
MDTQANYPEKLKTTYWDPLNVDYPVKKCFNTGISSETMARVWRSNPEVMLASKHPVNEERSYGRDYNVTNDLFKSQNSFDFGYKISETNRLNKHNSCIENSYIYPPSRQTFLLDNYRLNRLDAILDVNVPAMTAHGTSEMRNSYLQPLELCHKEIEPLDTSHDGFEKYLDPYLTTSRLHHRPFTAEQLNKPSNSKDVLTYYTYANIPWVRSPKPKIDEWHLPVSKNKSIYDREKFKDEFREIRTHRKPKWVPGAFRTENRDNYNILSQPAPHNTEEIKSIYKRSIARIQRDIQNGCYSTENSLIGSTKSVSSVLDQHVGKNKRFTQRSLKNT